MEDSEKKETRQTDINSPQHPHVVQLISKPSLVQLHLFFSLSQTLQHPFS